MFFPRFFGYMLEVIEEKIKEAGEGCGGQTELARSTLANSFQINYPDSLEEQRRIVAILDEAFEAIDKAKQNTEKNLQNVRELFDSCMQNIFSITRASGEERLLNDLLTIKHGFAFDGKYFANDGDYVLLTPGSFYEKGGYRERGPKTKFYNGQIPAGYILSEGDFLIAMTEQAPGLLGSPMIVPESNKYLHNQRLGLVQQKNGFAVDTRFLFHFFNTPEVRRSIHQSSSGLKVRHTSPKKVLELKGSFPPIEKQKELARTLDMLEAECDRLQRGNRDKSQHLDELKKSLMIKAFNGEI